MEQQKITNWMLIKASVAVVFAIIGALWTYRRGRTKGAASEGFKRDSKRINDAEARNDTRFIRNDIIKRSKK
jgi:FtsZ-interacting cell division protein ZipA